MSHRWSRAGSRAERAGRSPCRPWRQHDRLACRRRRPGSGSGCRSLVHVPAQRGAAGAASRRSRRRDAVHRARPRRGSGRADRPGVRVHRPPGGLRCGALARGRGAATGGGHGTHGGAHPDGDPRGSAVRPLPVRRLLVRGAGGSGDGAAASRHRRSGRGAVPHRSGLRRALLAARDMASGIGSAHCQATAAHRADAPRAGDRPRFYDGPMTLVASSIDRHFGCDTVRLWAGHADRLEVQRVDGDHLTVMQEPASAAAVARVIDHRLALKRENWTGLRPMPGFERPMILTTMRWFSAARLAHALAEAGFSVSACRPRAHALELVDGLTSDSRLDRLRPLGSLVTAIRQARPDIILADDERALVLLRRLHARTRTSDPELAALVARSLGDIEYWPSITSRTALAHEAQTLNIPAPATEVIGDADSFGRWAADQNLPIVLKTDGSWGGRGVAIIREASHLQEGWRTISNPPALPRALKRLLVNFEAGPLKAWVLRVRPVVNAQQFVTGREAIATVACVDGKVHALVCLEVIQASEATGPAAVVRIIDHPAMAEAARQLVGRFGFSGFCGFDFIITDSGEARLLELNPRVTPTSYLLIDGDYHRSRTIALFPPELVLCTEPGTEVAAVLDVPVRAPSLIRRGERMTLRQRRLVARMAHRLKHKLSASRY